MWTIYTWPELWDGEKSRYYIQVLSCFSTYMFSPYKSYFIFILLIPFFSLGIGALFKMRFKLSRYLE